LFGPGRNRLRASARAPRLSTVLLLRFRIAGSIDSRRAARMAWCASHDRRRGDAIAAASAWQSAADFGRGARAGCRVWAPTSGPLALAGQRRW